MCTFIDAFTGECLGMAVSKSMNVSLVMEAYKDMMKHHKDEFPEGAIISMPLHAEGKSKAKSFLYGVLSGVVEPVFGALTVLAAGFIVPAMPYLLSFAAGAMVYVVVEELIPEMSEGEHSNIGVLMFAFGFTVMMSLDVALG